MERIDVAILGSVVVDLTAYCREFPTETNRVRGNGFKLDFGGKSGNQAHMAALLRSKVVLLARLSEDMFGREYRNHLSKAGIDVVQPFIPPEQQSDASGVALTHTDAQLTNRIVVCEYDYNFFTPSILNKSSEMLSAIKSSAVLATCLTISHQTISAALKIAHKAGVFTILNPAPMPPTPEEIEELRDAFKFCDIVCPNEAEAAALLGFEGTRSLNEADIEQCLKQMKGSGCKFPIVTCNARGAFCLGAENRLFHVKAPIVEAVETLGASDCFVGALAHFVAHSEPRTPSVSVEMVQKAVLLASESVKSRGIQSSYPSFETSLPIIEAADN